MYTRKNGEIEVIELGKIETEEAKPTVNGDTVKPLNSGHIGGRTLVRCREVVPISEVD